MRLTKDNYPGQYQGNGGDKQRHQQLWAIGHVFHCSSRLIDANAAGLNGIGSIGSWCSAILPVVVASVRCADGFIANSRARRPNDCCAR